MAARFFKSTSQSVGEYPGSPGSKETWHRTASMGGERPAIAHDQGIPPVGSYSAGDD
jgi:hypothetical protein